MDLSQYLKSARMCERGFFHDYLEYTAFQESPEDFHLWVGIGLISAALGRKCHIDKGYFQIYPNLWIVLVAESAALHKSTALNMGKHVFNEALPEHPFFAQKITTEALIQFLTGLTKKFGNATATIFASEFSVFFGKSITDPTLIQALTDFYDCPGRRSYDTVSRGSEEMRNLCIGMMAGTTPEWIKSSLPEDSVGGGFTSRLLLIYRTETEKLKDAFPEKKITPKVLGYRDNCIQDLKAISEMEGKFRLDSSAEDALQNWYDMHDISKAPPGLRGYYGRKSDFVYKLSMILSASQSDNMLITAETVEMAVRALDMNETNMETALSQLSQTESGKVTAKVLEVIRRHGTIQHSDLLRSVRHMLNRDELWLAIGTLTQSGEVVTARTPTGGQLYSVAGEPRHRIAPTGQSK